MNRARPFGLAFPLRAWGVAVAGGWTLTRKNRAECSCTHCRPFLLRSQGLFVHDLARNVNQLNAQVARDSVDGGMTKGLQIRSHRGNVAGETDCSGSHCCSSKQKTGET